MTLQQATSWIRSHQAESVALLVSIVLLVAVGAASNSNRAEEIPQEDGTVWLEWQSTTIEMPDGKADLFWVQLAQGQKLQLSFDLSPSDSEVSVVVGTIRNPKSANWTWGYREEEYARVADGDTVTFEPDHTYDYGVWMKPRLDRTVTAEVGYRFST